MKCGWICLDCRNAEFKLEDLQQKLCISEGKEHRSVLSAGFMCQNCPAISDDISTFLQEECACGFDKGSSPAARPAASPTPEHTAKHAPLTIKRKPGRIGGEFMEVPYIPPSAASSDEHTRMPEPPKRPAKETWKDEVPSRRPNTSVCGIPKPPHTDLKAPNSAKRSLPNPRSPISRTEVMSKIEQAQAELRQLLLLQALERERTWKICS